MSNSIEELVVQVGAVPIFKSCNDFEFKTEECKVFIDCMARMKHHNVFTRYPGSLMGDVRRDVNLGQVRRIFSLMLRHAMLCCGVAGGIRHILI